MIYAVLQQQAVGPEGHTLTLRWGDALYFATLPALKLDPYLAAIPPGSEVSVVAVPSVFLDAQRHPSNFRLWLARANDVQVLRSASWWTPGRVRAGAILLAVVLMVTLGFGFQLTRRTRALEAEVRERKRVEEELREARKGLEDTVAQREFRLFSINEEREQIARELRQRESLVQEVIEALPDIVVVRDATGRIVLSNAAAGQFLGIKPSKKPNARVLTGVPIASPELSPADRAVLKSGREIASPPEQWQDRDGSVRWFEVTRRRITRPDGTRFLLGVATEVTARKLAEEEQRRARESADATGRAVDVQVTRLRRKIEPDPKNPRYLQTVRGVGYRLAPDL
jgi:PAS domain S-box-containing protein